MITVEADMTHTIYILCEQLNYCWETYISNIEVIG